MFQIYTNLDESEEESIEETINLSLIIKIDPSTLIKDKKNQSFILGDQHVDESL